MSGVIAVGIHTLSIRDVNRSRIPKTYNEKKSLKDKQKHKYKQYIGITQF